MSQIFKDFVQSNQTIILDGPMGTELQRRGYQTKLPLWSATANEDAFDLVQSIHEDYFKAGAEIAITNTFRTTPRAYAKVGRSEKEAWHALSQAVRAAKAAQNSVIHPTFIGGSIAPLEDCYEPESVPAQDALNREHAEIAQKLADSGVDFIALETINDINEATAMAMAAANTGLPFFISFVIDDQAHLLDGNSVNDAVAATNLPGRVGVSINCRAIATLDTALDRIIADNPDLTLGIYPNGFGQPHDDLGWVFENNSDSLDKFVSYSQKWSDKGIKFIGGCCGCTPDYISALSNALKPLAKAA